MSDLAPEKRVLAARILARLRDVPRHRAALDEAIAAFGESFEREAFLAAAASSDPPELLKAYAIQSGFENLQNHVTGLTREALELAGRLAPGERANAARDLRRLQRAGAISKARCERLIAVQDIRSSLQHADTETAPADLHEAVALLLAELDGFLAGYRRWLGEQLDWLPSQTA